MRTFDADILIVPGYSGADADHWLSRWQRRLKTARRVEQQNWLRPERAAWTEALSAAIGQAGRPVVLVAHSCGVATVAHAFAGKDGGHVVGAFLAAPASEAATRRMPGVGADFTPFPHDPLPFPSLLIASRNDPNCSYDEAGELALAWGSMLIDAGEAGHLDVASGHGPWPEGAMRFGSFLRQLKG